jgi:hypothetical protein
MSIYVTIPYDKEWKALEWVKAHCPSYITNDTHMSGYNTYDTTKMDYFFGSSEDALIFKLKWQ